MTDFSEEKEVYGQLQAVLNFISILSTEANGEVELNDDLSSKVNDLKIKFYGDMVLPQNPTTFEEAVKIYKELPNFVTEQEAHSVPMKVYLAPLKKLDPLGTFAEIREISKSLITNVVTIMQELEDAKEEALDLSRSREATYFSFTARKISRFLNLLRQYKQRFQGHIAPLLVGSGKEESELSSYLEQHFNCPFSKVNIEGWLQRAREETSALDSFVQQLQNVVFCENTGKYFREILKYDKIVSLNMYFPENRDPVLDQMDNFLAGRNSTQTSNAADLWFRDWQTMVAFQIALEDFLNYRRASEEDMTTAFIYALLPSPDRSQRLPFTEIKAIYMEGRRRFQEGLYTPKSTNNTSRNNQQ